MSRPQSKDTTEPQWSGHRDTRSSRLDNDEDDVRVRPRPGSRPRTRTRPRHEDATEGIVTAVDRGRYTCQTMGHSVTAMRARELGRRAVVVGDQVALVGDSSGQPDTLARIVRVAPRSSVLRRSADDADPVERVLVANADQLVVVIAVTDPPPRPRFIDRCLVAAYDGGLDPLLCLTKTDLAEPTGLLAAYAPLGIPAVVTEPGVVEPLRRRLVNRCSVLVGQSGVGKSTLVNALVPAAVRTTGAVNPLTGRGRHVSSSVVALPLPEPGWLIDTPGIRSFGLAHVRPGDVLAAFPELLEGAEGCPPGCTHAAAAPTCALDGWVRAGRAEPARLASYRRLLDSRSSPP